MSDRKLFRWLMHSFLMDNRLFQLLKIELLYPKSHETNFCK